MPTQRHKDTKTSGSKDIRKRGNGDVFVFYNKLVKGYDHGMSCNV